MAETKEKVTHEIVLQFVESNDENGNKSLRVDTRWTEGMTPYEVIAHIEMTKQSIVAGIFNGAYNKVKKEE